MTFKVVIGLVAGMAAAAAAATTAHAGGGRGAAFSLLKEGEAVRPPRAYAEMCERRPELCPSRAIGGELDGMRRVLAQTYGRDALGVRPPELTSARYREIEQVNLTVNRTIQPVMDSGRDYWSFSSRAGDCEEYVMMKRELLAQLGWPRTALRVTVVKDLNDQYHAVLVVSTQNGEFVLDNLTNQITRVADSPYRFVVSQSARRPGVWVRVRRES
ncbi:MAG: transglutaminase-like cysteine peptidase [Pseudomonadota bacterium]